MMPMQMDAAGNQWFSGTQMRQEHRAILIITLDALNQMGDWCGSELPSPPTENKGMNRKATARRRRNVLTVNKNKGREINAVDSFYLLTLPSNG